MANNIPVVESGDVLLEAMWSDVHGMQLMCYAMRRVGMHTHGTHRRYVNETAFRPTDCARQLLLFTREVVSNCPTAIRRNWQ